MIRGHLLALLAIMALSACSKGNDTFALSCTGTSTSSYTHRDGRPLAPGGTSPATLVVVADPSAHKLYRAIDPAPLYNACYLADSCELSITDTEISLHSRHTSTDRARLLSTIDTAIDRGSGHLTQTATMTTPGSIISFTTQARCRPLTPIPPYTEQAPNPFANGQ